MKCHAFRLLPDQDLKKELKKFVEKNNIKAGVILSAVGSLKQANLRLADELVVKKFKEKFEIVSITGTLSVNGSHLHISISDKQGKTIGGHLKEDCLIYTTAEIVILEMNKVFDRKSDENTGFKEFKVL